MGVPKRVKLQLDGWTDKETTKIMPLDDYNFLVRLNFLGRINALLIPFVNCV